MPLSTSNFELSRTLPPTVDSTGTGRGPEDRPLLEISAGRSAVSRTEPGDGAFGRCPRLAWFKIWVAALCLTCAAVVGLESWFRAHDYRPMITDGPDLWAYYRNRIGKSRKEVVLLGDSRMAQDFHMRTFQERYPDRPLTMLAISAAPSPLEALRDLAEDQDFRGTVLCGVVIWSFRDRDYDAQKAYVDRGKIDSPLRIEAQINLWLQSRLVCLNPDLRPAAVVRSLVGRGRLPKAEYRYIHPDRSIAANYQIPEIGRLRKKYEADKRVDKTYQPASNREFVHSAKDLRKYVRKIEGRGGHVVFIRMPTSGGHWKYTHDRFPREKFWDKLAELSDADTIHFTDVPGMACFECPDTSHLDFRDTPAFTEALLDELARRDLLPPPTADIAANAPETLTR